MAAVARGGVGAEYVRVKDLATLVELPPAALVAWTLPEPRWDRVAAAGLARPGKAAAGEREYLESFVRGDELGVPAEDVLRGYLRNVRLVQAQYLRCHHPRGWRPTIRLEGREHLDRALEAGRGAIVWKAPFLFATLVTMMALHGAGYDPSCWPASSTATRRRGSASACSTPCGCGSRGGDVTLTRRSSPGRGPRPRSAPCPTSGGAGRPR
jgi:hypothetical protein